MNSSFLPCKNKGPADDAGEIEKKIEIHVTQLTFRYQNQNYIDVDPMTSAFHCHFDPTHRLIDIRYIAIYLQTIINYAKYQY